MSWRRASGPVVGIVNGMDIGDWSPMVDKYIRQRYGKEDVGEGKTKNKEAVQTLLGLPVCPLVVAFPFPKLPPHTCVLSGLCFKPCFLIVQPHSLTSEYGFKVAADDVFV